MLYIYIYINIYIYIIIDIVLLVSDWWNTVERVLLGTADSLKPYLLFRNRTDIFCDTKALIEVSNRIRPTSDII